MIVNLMLESCLCLAFVCLLLFFCLLLSLPPFHKWKIFRSNTNTTAKLSTTLTRRYKTSPKTFANNADNQVDIVCCVCCVPLVAVDQFLLTRCLTQHLTSQKGFCTTQSFDFMSSLPICDYLGFDLRIFCNLLSKEDCFLISE